MQKNIKANGHIKPLILTLIIIFLLSVYSQDTSKIRIEPINKKNNNQQPNNFTLDNYFETQLLLIQFPIKNQSSYNLAAFLIFNQLSFKEENYLFMTIPPKDEWWLFKNLDAQAKAFRNKTGFDLGSGTMSRNYFMFYKNFVPSIHHYRSMERKLINPTLRPRYDAEQ